MKQKKQLTAFEFSRRLRWRVGLITSSVMLVLLGSMSLEYGTSLTFMIFIFIAVNGFAQIFTSMEIDGAYERYKDYWRERQ